MDDSFDEPSESPRSQAELYKGADSCSSTHSERPTDSPELHQGRKRAAPHLRGQWASHVYLERMYSLSSLDLPLSSHSTPTQTVTPSASLRKVLQQSFDAAAVASSEDASAAVHSLLPGIRTDPQDTLDEALHLSLSRPLMLLTNQRDDLKKAVARIADRFRPCVPLGLAGQLAA